MNGGTTILAAVEIYLEERRQLGFDLRIAGRQLMRFARYADALGHKGPLTLELQLGWAREHVNRTGPVTWARRIEVVRPFAAYYRQFEPASVVPDLKVFGHGHRRLTPHIYTDHEVCELLEETGRLTPQAGLRPATYQALFGLIAAAGLRISEALNLRDADVDLQAGSVTVRQTKFNKSRCLPLHPSAVQALAEYRVRRNQMAARLPDMTFFASPEGQALSLRGVENVFARLRERLGWKPRGEHPKPRIHDLRHTFAVRRVQQWHQTGLTMENAMFWLCTYLGHAKISDTYWYLTGVPELMAVVGEKFGRFVHGESGHG